MDRIFTKNFFCVFGALFCTAMVMYTLMGTITEYASELGAGASVAGLVSGIYVFGGLCSRVYSGRALETVGWKKLTLLFIGIHGAACIFYFAAEHILLLILIRFIHGIGFGATANGIVTMGMAILPGKRFAEACGYMMMATTIAVGLGPYFGGLVYDTAGPYGCFLTALILCVLTFFFITRLDVKALDPGNRKERAAGEMPTAKGIHRFLQVNAVPVSLLTAFTALGYGAVMSFYRLFAAEQDLAEAFTWFFLVYSLVLLFLRPLAGKLQDQRGDRIVCIPAVIGQFLGLLVMAVHPCFVTVMLCAVGCGMGFGTLNSACNAIVCRKAGAARRSYAVSTFYICCDGMIGFGPAILGSFAVMTGSYTVIYVLAACITLLALPLCFIALKKS